MITRNEMHQVKSVAQQKTNPELTQAVQNEEVAPPTTCKHQVITNMSNLPAKNN